MIQGADKFDLIRDLLQKHVRLADAGGLAPSQDLYSAGMTCFDAVRLMQALEQAFGVEFPDRMLNKQSFASLDSIAGCLAEITPTVAAA